MSKKLTFDTLMHLKSFIKSSQINTIKTYYTEDAFKDSEIGKEVTLKYEEFDYDSSSMNELTNKLIRASFLPNGEFIKNEFEAGKILFNHLKDLTPNQASDIGFWTYHNHFTFYRYIAKRWNGLWKENEQNPNYILNHWIQTNSNQSGLIDYPISGLWWSFYLTQDSIGNKEFKLTEILFKNESLRTKYLGQARFARHKPAILGVLEFIQSNEDHITSLESVGRAIVPYINLLGGIRPLSFFSKDWFIEKLNNQFGEQIKNGDPLFIRPESTLKNKYQTNQKNDNRKDFDVLPLNNKANSKKFDKYFCLNKDTGSYIISNFKNTQDWNYCVGFNNNKANQFLIHFYREGKIKKSLINENIHNKQINREYFNGKNSTLHLVDLKLISDKTLFGIAFKNIRGIYVKVMDAQDETLFRIDNEDLTQEGKKILYYLTEPFKVSYKILPYHLRDNIGSIFRKSPTSYGIDINNQYYNNELNTLKEYWPSLFNGEIKWT
jgi:hypothetical protein